MNQTNTWRDELERWLEPFIQRFHHTKQARWAPVYLQGLLGEGERKSVEPMAARVAPGQTQQWRHFVSTSNWALEPLEATLTKQANALVGGPDALLIVDDTALVKKGRHSAGVGHQYCGELGKKANCQSLVSLTLALYEVPVPIGLRLFLPESWDEDTVRRENARIPAGLKHRPKWRIALEEIDRVMNQGARFGAVVADAGYGTCGPFRRALTHRGLRWAVGVLPNLQVYPADVGVTHVANAHGRPRKHPAPDVAAVSAESMVALLPNAGWRTITWRQGWKGPLTARFAMIRVRVAEGDKISRGRRLPCDEVVWLVCEQRAHHERRYYLANLPDSVSGLELARLIKGRWACEQAHQQMKQQLGLDHYEGRSWLGLHHHTLLVMIGYAFLQWLRLRDKKGALATVRRLNPPCRKSSGNCASG